MANISIYADATLDVEFDAESREFFAPRTPPTGPIFTIRALDYWQTQTAPTNSTPETGREQMAFWVKHCLIAIDGDMSRAERFKAAPGWHVLSPLFVACVQHTMGN